MFEFYRTRFTCSKYFANLFVILFIVRGVASLIESDVYGRIGNTTASLRLTRQKVLIQAVQSPESLGQKRQAREKHATNNQDEYEQPDIVVEEFRIRAKINFQARPRTCKDLLSDFSNDTKSRIGLSSSRDPRIVYCRAESLISKNQTRFEDKSSTQRSNDMSIKSPDNVEFQRKNFLSETTTDLSNRKIIFNDDEKNDVQPINYNEKSNENSNNLLSSWKKEKNRRIDSSEEFLQNALFHRRVTSGAETDEIDRRPPLSILYNFRDNSRADLMENKTTSFRPLHRPSKSHQAIYSSKKKNAEHSETKREEIERESKTNYFHKPKGLILDTFGDKLDENSRWNENPKFRGIESTDNKVEMRNAESFAFFDDYKIAETQNNELEIPGLLSVSSDFEKKLHKRSIKNTQIVQPCYRKSTKNVTNYPAALKLKKREGNIGIPMIASQSGDRETFYIENDQLISHNFSKKLDSISKGNDNFGSRRRDRRSLNALNNFTTAPNNNNQKKVPKKSANSNKKKKTKSENSTKNPQSELPQSLLSKTRNSTKTKIKLAKRSNDTMRNFTMPPSLAMYFTFFSALFRPFFEIVFTDSKNQSTLLREAIKKNNLSNVREEKVVTDASIINASSVYGGEFFFNFTKLHFPNSTEIHFSNSTKINFPTSTEIQFQTSTDFHVPNSTEIHFPNSTEIPLSNSTEFHFPTSTETDPTISTEFSVPSSIKKSVSTSTVSTLPISPKASREALGDSNVQSSMEPALKKARDNTDIYLHEKFATTKVQNSDPTDSLMSTTKFVPKGFVNNTITPTYQPAESLLQTEKKIYEIWNSRSEDKERKLSEIETSAIKLISMPTENLTKNLSEATTNKPEDVSEKTTLNFTIIDTNCTEPYLLNYSLPINSANRSSNIGEVMSQMSTYPTLRRYSRNDTVDESPIPKTKLLDFGKNDAKNRQTKNSLNDLNPSNAARKGRGGFGNRGRKRLRYKGKVQHPFIASSLSRTAKQSWRSNGSVITISSIASSSSTLPAGISDSMDSSGNGRSSASPILGDLPGLLSPTITPSIDWQQIQMSKNMSILKPDSRDYPTHTLPHNSEESSISVSTEDSMNEVPRPISSTPASYEFFENKELEASSLPWETSAGSNFGNFWPSNEIPTKQAYPARESKPDEAVVMNEILTKELIDFPTVLYDRSISVDPVMTRNTDNAIISKYPVGYDLGGKEEIRSDEISLTNFKMEETKTNEVNESSTISGKSITLSTILPAESKRGHKRIIIKNPVIDESSTFSYNESSVTDSSIINEVELPTGRNKAVTLDEAIEREFRQAFVSGSTKKQSLLNSAPEMGRTESFGAKPLIAFNHATNPPDNRVEKVDLTYPERTTEFYFQMRNNEYEKMEEENFTEKAESSIALEIIDSLNSSVTPKEISPKVTSLNWEDTMDVDFDSVTRNPDIERPAFSSKTKSVIAVPASAMNKTTIEMKNSGLASLPRTVRRARDTRTLSEYEELEEPELDYDIDSLGETETVTEATRKMVEDAEGSRGASIPKNSPFTVGLPHSAVHGVFFEDNKANEDSESTVIPGIHQIRDDQFLPVSTAASSNSLKLSNDFPDNLTNFLDEPSLLEFVKSLEDFLFDDSATGTSDQKKLLLRDQDLAGESSNMNSETRSAIFKTKELSIVNKKIGKNAKKVDATKNGGKTKPNHSMKSTAKKTSDLSSSGKRVRSKTTRKTNNDRENEKIKKEKMKASLKARKAKISKPQSAFNDRRAGGKARNSTDKIPANKWKSNVNKK